MGGEILLALYYADMEKSSFRENDIEQLIPQDDKSILFDENIFREFVFSINAAILFLSKVSDYTFSWLLIKNETSKEEIQIFQAFSYNKMETLAEEFASTSRAFTICSIENIRQDKSMFFQENSRTFNSNIEFEQL